MNDTRIEQKANLAQCPVQVQCPASLAQTKVKEDTFEKITTGMGEDMTRLLKKSGTEANFFTAETNVKESTPVTNVYNTLLRRLLFVSIETSNISNWDIIYSRVDVLRHSKKLASSLKYRISKITHKGASSPRL